MILFLLYQTLPVGHRWLFSFPTREEANAFVAVKGNVLPYPKFIDIPNSEDDVGFIIKEAPKGPLTLYDVVFNYDGDAAKKVDWS